VGCDLFRDRTENLAYAGDRQSEAAIVAEQSDVVILCLGLDETLEGEEGDTGNSYASGDKVDLQLPKVQQELMKTVADAGKPVVLCLMAGSDIDLSYGEEHFDAILDLWYPGAQGGRAAAKLLFGEVSPSGKLPVTFYETLEELPEFEDYSMKGRTYRYMEQKAQYPFGYGLTYGRVRVVEAMVQDEPTESASQACMLRANVRNEGAVDTDEVIQVYVKNCDSEFAPRNPSLCAFQRVHLAAGEQREVCLSIPEAAFTVVDDAGDRIRNGKRFTLYVGCSQPDERSAELFGARPVEVQIER
jgi:beta-glucosidase